MVFRRPAERGGCFTGADYAQPPPANDTGRNITWIPFTNPQPDPELEENVFHGDFRYGANTDLTFDISLVIRTTTIRD